MLLGVILMDQNIVLSYDYSSRNRRRRRTNVPPLRAISMAMAVRRCNTEHITRYSMTRASPEATECRHRATTRSVSPRRPPKQQQTKWRCKIHPPLLAILMYAVVRRYYTAHIAWCQWFVAFLKAAKRHHPASTRSDITQSDMLTPDFGGIFHHQINKKGLELTFWPLITIGVWHIKLTRTT